MSIGASDSFRDVEVDRKNEALKRGLPETATFEEIIAYDMK